MQSLARGVRHGSLVGRCLQVYPRHTTPSSRVHWEGRRKASNYGPWNWLQQKLAAAPKKSSSPVVKHQDAPSDEPVKEEVFVESTKEIGKGGKGKVSQLPPALEEPKRKLAREHKYSTANWKISHRKLNMLGRQISGKPIDHAIMQMQFSEKRASNRIKSMLVTAKLHATVYKNMDPSKLIVSEAWVTKGPKQLKRLEPRGRGKFGIRVHPDSRMSVVLRHGKTFEQLQKEQRARRLRRIVSSGIVREDIPLRNPAGMWQW
ncbi:hypothetical protein HYDPIDRAFT_122562 [Hydnomerulius pinastri MD-312]|nr:hypothetical protein HYDPIDRAFT_122562 [Hydnomerulius pinastri MD-312]